MDKNLNELIEGINYSDDCISEISLDQMTELFNTQIDDVIKKNSGASLIALAALYQSEELLNLLNIDIDVCNTTEDAASALMLCIANNNMHAIKFLIESGADINLENEHGETALFGSTFFGNVAAVKVLLAAGAHTQAQSEQAMSPLDAVLQGFLDSAEEDTLSENNRVYLDIASCLVEAGVDATEKDEFGSTFLDNIDEVQAEIEAVLESQADLEEEMTQEEKEKFAAGLNQTITTLRDLKAILQK